MRFSLQGGANDISLDPVRPTSKFALRACMGQDDPGDQGDLSNILHLTHKEYPNMTWLWRIWVVLTQNHSIGTIWIFAYWLIMVRSRNWPDLWSQISKIRDIQVVGIYDLMKHWRFGNQSDIYIVWPLRSLKVRNPFLTLTWPGDLTFGDLGLNFLHKVSNSILSRYWQNGGAARRRFPAIREKPEGRAFFAPLQCAC